MLKVFGWYIIIIYKEAVEMFDKKENKVGNKIGNTAKEIDLDELEQVTGGGAIDNVPRVPEKPIDDSLRNKI